MAISTSFKVILISLMILAGALNTLVYKVQNSQIVNQGNTLKTFFHPFMQVATMFVGETLALGIFFLFKYRNPKQYQLKSQKAVSEGKKLTFNKFKMAIPALCDCAASTLQLFALNFIAGSVYQMLRGGAIITTFIFSIVLLKVKAQKFQIAGSGLAFIGVGIVGTSALIFSDSTASSSQASLQAIGYIMLIIGLVINGFQFVYEKSLFDKYHIEPLQLIGYEGIFGLIASVILVTILSFIPCTFGQDACAYTQDGQAFFQNAYTYFTSCGQTVLLITASIMGIFSIMTFNITGVSVTKYINALARSICDVSRTLIVWIVGVLVTLTLGQDKDNYHWESLKGWQLVLESIGFILLIMGNLIYNEIIKVSFLGSTELKNDTLLDQQDSNQANSKSVLSNEA